MSVLQSMWLRLALVIVCTYEKHDCKMLFCVCLYVAVLTFYVPDYVLIVVLPFLCLSFLLAMGLKSVLMLISLTLVRIYADIPDIVALRDRFLLSSIFVNCYFWWSRIMLLYEVGWYC